MAGMGNLRDLSPCAARDAAGFVESMKQLKELSGLTYRELEEQAARNGDVLARSTLADVLRRPGLPRPEVLAAFVRACGDGQRVGAWLEARERIAEAKPEPLPAEPEPETEPTAPPPPEEPARQRRDRRRLLVIASALSVPLLAVGAWSLLPTDADATHTPADGWVTIRPADRTDLCLTDGRDRAGAYDSAVAVRLPCAQAPVPRTYLEPAGEGMYRIQWHHPEMGKGCLTVMDRGPAKGMIEPRDDCTGATVFHLDPAPDDSDGFRLRPARSDQCIGTTDNETTAGTEAVQEPCTDTPDQYFVVRED